MQIEIWSDIVCPWCYVGVVRLEQALAEERLTIGIDLDIVFRAFELDPMVPSTGQPLQPYLVAKFGDEAAVRSMQDRLTWAGAELGIDFSWEGMWRRNSFDAHRLLAWSASSGGPGIQRVLEHRLLRAYFTEGLDIADHDVLADLAEEVGLTRLAAAEALATGAGRDEALADEARAADLGIRAVPTFLIDGLFAVQGAQQVEAWRDVFAEVRAGQP
jgi:predicted DsbA family dithiol-disulfide isomerase